MALTLTHTENPMKNLSQHKKVFGITLLVGGLAGGFLTVEKSEAQKFPFFDRNVVLLDWVERATNTFVVENMSSTVDVKIHRGLDCAAARQKLWGKGYVLGPGAGGLTWGEVTSLDHFLMLFFPEP